MLISVKASNIEEKEKTLNDILMIDLIVKEVANNLSSPCFLVQHPTESMQARSLKLDFGKHF